MLEVSILAAGQSIVQGVPRCSTKVQPVLNARRLLAGVVEMDQGIEKTGFHFPPKCQYPFQYRTLAVLFPIYGSAIKICERSHSALYGASER